jgi:phosphatidylinositol-3-phosphatase
VALKRKAIAAVGVVVVAAAVTTAWTANQTALARGRLVTVEAPASGSTVSGVIVLKAATASGARATQVKWYVDNAQVAWDGNGAPWERPWNSATVGDGTHRLFAKASVTGRRWVTSPQIKFKVRNARAAGTSRVPTGICGQRNRAPARFRHVVVVVMENKPFARIIDAADAPYTNALAKRCGLAANYYAVTHGSLPDYIALVSGNTAGLDGASCNPGPKCQSTSRSIFAQLGGDWWAFQEAMPSNCHRVNSHTYAVRHNPPAYFPRLTSCARNDVPYGQFKVSRKFIFVTPDLCDDTHNCPVAVGDRWLSIFVKRVVTSRAYRSGGTALFITWDEDDGSASNHVPMIVVSPYTPSGVRAAGFFDHYSALRTWEEMLGLPCLDKACTAPSMRSAFHLS